REHAFGPRVPLRRTCFGHKVRRLQTGAGTLRLIASDHVFLLPIFLSHIFPLAKPATGKYHLPRPSKENHRKEYGYDVEFTQTGAAGRCCSRAGSHCSRGGAKRETAQARLISGRPKPERTESAQTRHGGNLVRSWRD